MIDFVIFCVIFKRIHIRGGKELSGRHDAGGGVFRVTQKTVSFTIVLLGGHIQDLTN